MFKMVDVVMLPTNEKSKLYIAWDEMRFGAEITPTRDYQPYHLYFLSDEEIKEGDWVLNLMTNRFGKAKITSHIYMNIEIDNGQFIDLSSKSNYKKIIATTDSSLTIPALGHEFTGWTNYLPQPSQSFLEKYVEEYNKGNQIKEVMVEYETKRFHIYDRADQHTHDEDHEVIKINSKDNTITIRKIEVKTYTEEFVDWLIGKPGQAERMYQRYLKEKGYDKS